MASSDRDGPLRWNPFRWQGNVYHRHDPALYWFHVRHYFTGVRRGCSCSRCFYHPKSPWAPIIAERLNASRPERAVSDGE